MLRALALVAAIFTVVRAAPAQDLEPLPALEPHAFDHGAPPQMHFGGGQFFSQDLGTVLRIRYNTESYGQNDHGNLDIGTFQAINLADAIAFFDGQVTLNDVQGVGFNLGAGYRWLSIMPYMLESERITGVSVWADGTSTEEGNFFPQVGVSYESLGEMWDLRANGYIPVGDDEQLGDFVATDEIGFQGNFLSQITEAVIDQSFYAAELEIARRLGHERDAWAFAGPYFLTNEFDDTVGYEVGLRGYAYPDLLLQFAVSDDDIFHTNATFSIVWFVGRTRTNFQPTCGLPDRFREPVMRNDYVVLTQGRTTGGIPLTDPDGNAIRIVHVDSSAAEGGDGTFENPFNMLSDINGAGSQAGDIILAHAQSTFTADQPAMLKDDQRLLGEGNGFEPTIVTAEEGTIVIPETAPGARNATRPRVLNPATNAVTLANDNEVANFDFDGGQSAIVGTSLTGNGNLHDLTIRDTMNNAIALSMMEGDFAITEVSVMNGDAFALALSEFTSTGSVTLDEFTYDGGAGTAGGIQFDDYDGTFMASDSELMNGMGPGVEIMGPSDGTFNFQSTVSLMNIDGTAFFIDGGGSNEFTGSVTMAGTITNDMGRSVEVSGMSGTDEPSVVFSGNITDTGQGMFISDNAGGSLIFSGTLLDLDPTAGTAITLLNNNDSADISFSARLDIDSGAFAAFDASGDGTLTVSNTGNTIDTTTGRPIRIVDMNVSNAGVNFSEVNRTTATAATAILLEDNTGGPIVVGTVGDTAGESGTIAGGNADTVVINDSANVTISGLVLDNAAGFSGVHVEKTTGGTQTVNLNDLDINNGDRGIEVTGGGAGALNMNIADTTIDNPTAVGMSISGVTSGTTQVTNLDVTTTAADAINLTNNTGATMNLSQLDINTTTGDGFVATGGGTLNVTGTTNTVDTTTGVGVQIQDMTIGSSGVNFQTVNVTNGATNAIVLENLTGTGQVSIGSATGAADSGGTLTTTDSAIIVRNTQNVDLNNIRIASAASNALLIQHTAAATTTMDVTIDSLNLDSTTGTGVSVSGADNNAFNLRLLDSDLQNDVVMNITGSGAFGLLAEGNTIVTTGTDVAFALTFSGAAQDGDVTIRGGNSFTAANASAFDFNVNGTNADIEFALDNNVFTNNSAGSPTVDVDVSGGATLDANVVNNSSSNSAGGGEEFEMTSDGSTSRINLNIVNNSSGTYELVTSNNGGGFNFGVVDRDAADANNPANVIFNPIITDFEDIPGPVEAPTVP